MTTKVTATRNIIPGNDTLGTKEKVQHYLVIGEDKNIVVVRCGEENYNLVMEMEKKSGGKKSA